MDQPVKKTNSEAANKFQKTNEWINQSQDIDFVNFQNQKRMSKLKSLEMLEEQLQSQQSYMKSKLKENIIQRNQELIKQVEEIKKKKTSTSKDQFWQQKNYSQIQKKPKDERKEDPKPPKPTKQEQMDVSKQVSKADRDKIDTPIKKKKKVDCKKLKKESKSDKKNDLESKFLHFLDSESYVDLNAKQREQYQNFVEKKEAEKKKKFEMELAEKKKLKEEAEAIKRKEEEREQGSKESQIRPQIEQKKEELIKEQFKASKQEEIEEKKEEKQLEIKEQEKEEMKEEIKEDQNNESEQEVISINKLHLNRFKSQYEQKEQELEEQKEQSTLDQLKKTRLEEVEVQEEKQEKKLSFQIEMSQREKQKENNNSPQKESQKEQEDHQSELSKGSEKKQNRTNINQQNSYSTQYPQEEQKSEKQTKIKKEEEEKEEKEKEEKEKEEKEKESGCHEMLKIRNLLSFKAIKDDIKKKERERKEQQKRKMYILQDPKSVTIRINMTTSMFELSVIKRLIEKNEWKKTYGLEGDILWTGKVFNSQLAMTYLNFRVNRVPGMKTLCGKKHTAYFIQKFEDYFPSLYDFFPKTYNLPEDFQEFFKAYSGDKSKLYIAKPDQGTQGQGIFLVNEMKQLFVNECVEMASCKKNLIVQEYIQNPLLIDGKKFDLRLYVLITSIQPLVIYLNEEGLARFCTENYQAPTNQNINNQFMHLTNYSLNKKSGNFVHQPKDFLNVNNASKRTYTSAKKSLLKLGVDIAKMKNKIEQNIVKFMQSMQPFLLCYLRDIYQDKWRDAKCFHVLGFDILVDKDLKPWILEVNANASLDITQELLDDNEEKTTELSQLDYYVKSKVLEDAFLIVMKSAEEQIQQIGRGKHFNSYKMIVDGQTPIENIDLFEKMINVFSFLSGHRFGPINSNKFNKLSNVQKLTNEEMLKSDYDLLFKRIVLKHNLVEMNFEVFIEAIENLAYKLLYKKARNYTKQKAVQWVMNRAIEFVQSAQQQQQQVQLQQKSLSIIQRGQSLQNRPQTVK